MDSTEDEDFVFGCAFFLADRFASAPISPIDDNARDGVIADAIDFRTNTTAGVAQASG